MPTWAVVVTLGTLSLASIGISAVAMMPRPVVGPTSQIASAFPSNDDGAEPVATVFIGDSITAGSGSTTPSRRWTAIVSARQGWIEFNRALAGTGYIADASAAGCGKLECHNYGNAIQALTTLDPSVVVISGGRNDGPAPQGYSDIVKSTIEAAMTKWPTAQVFVTSALWDDEPEPDWLAKNEEIVRAATIEAGATFLDLGQPIEGRADLVGPDGVHPNDAGYAAIADSWDRASEELLLSSEPAG